MLSSAPLLFKKRSRLITKPNLTRRCIYGLASVQVNPLRNTATCLARPSNWPARICAHADPGRILMAGAVRDQYPGKEQSFSDLGEMTPKGFDRAIQMYEVQWAA